MGHNVVTSSFMNAPLTLYLKEDIILQFAVKLLDSIIQENFTRLQHIHIQGENVLFCFDANLILKVSFLIDASHLNKLSLSRKNTTYNFIFIILSKPTILM